MSSEQCYLCQQPVPAGQSFYEDHGAKVCLACFRETPRCKKCKFPSNQLEVYPGMGSVCEFCRADFQDSGMRCYLCEKTIPAWMSHYADYGKTVCQECFAEADRCFLCRFPQSVVRLPNFGHVCGFCQEDLVDEKSDLAPLVAPLKTFLAQYKHPIEELPKFQWMDWNLVMGMQREEPPPVKIKFFDEFLHFAYPIFFMKGKLYCIRSIPRAHFMAHLAGQLAAFDLCQTYRQPHLLGNNPFVQRARGWCHWVAHSTAGVLKYKKVAKQLSRWPEQFEGDFQKYQAMAEFRKPKEIIALTHGTLKEYSRKYL